MLVDNGLSRRRWVKRVPNVTRVVHRPRVACHHIVCAHLRNDDSPILVEDSLGPRQEIKVRIQDLIGSDLDFSLRPFEGCGQSSRSHCKLIKSLQL